MEIAKKVIKPQDNFVRLKYIKAIIAIKNEKIIGIYFGDKYIPLKNKMYRLLEKESRMKKVFCSECKWLQETPHLIDFGYDTTYKCLAPQNNMDNWYKRNGGTPISPKKKNKSNDCEWFEPKGIDCKWFEPKGT